MKTTLRKIRKIIKEEIDQGTTLIKIDDSLERCLKMKDLIYDFCNYTCDELGIDRDLVDISIVDNRDRSGIRTTAFYNPQNHKIAVYGKDRAVVDICRSVAHELTHMQQMLADRINFPVQDVGGQIEDEANSKAGEIIKSFAQSENDRKRIYENARLRLPPQSLPLAD